MPLGGAETPPPGSPALLWDESHFWGILLLKALEDLDVPFH